MIAPTAQRESADIVVAALSGKNCWHVSCGGAAANTFKLALGAKIPRAESESSFLGNSDEHDRYEGEANLLVWCSWRLDSDVAPLTSSDDTQKNVVVTLNRLVGQTILKVGIEMPGWDLRIDFSDRLSLRIFCDHVPGDPSFDGNWDLFLRDQIISIGVGSQFESESR